MAKYKVGFIGTGKKQKPSSMGFAMAYQHAAAYAKLDNCELVACADIVEENAAAFAETNGVQRVYTNHQEMLNKEDLDIVSVCVWPHLHAKMTIDCALAGVRAVHCEKPMAHTWGASRLMAQECARRDVQLTFNHQRRFGKPFREARSLLKAGEIGELVRLEGGIGNIYDGGTHFIDMFGFCNDESPAKWIVAQIECRREQRIFGALAESDGIVYWQYQNGVCGLIATGESSSTLPVITRLVGTEGAIEVGAANAPVLQVRRKGSGNWEAIDCGNEGLHGPGYIDRAIADLVDALGTGREPELSARRALNTTEIIFGAYESARQGMRVDFPLTIDDNPLEELFVRQALSRGDGDDTL